MKSNTDIHMHIYMHIYTACIVLVLVQYVEVCDIDPVLFRGPARPDARYSYESLLVAPQLVALDHERSNVSLRSTYAYTSHLSLIRVLVRVKLRTD